MISATFIFSALSLRWQGTYYWLISGFRQAASSHTDFMKTVDETTKTFCVSLIAYPTSIEENIQIQALNICLWHHGPLLFPNPSSFLLKNNKIHQLHSIDSIFKPDAILLGAPCFMNCMPGPCYFTIKSVSHTFRFFANYIRTYMLSQKRKTYTPASCGYLPFEESQNAAELAGI